MALRSEYFARRSVNGLGWKPHWVRAGNRLDLALWRGTRRLAGDSRWLFGVFAEGIQYEFLRLEEYARRAKEYREEPMGLSVEDRASGTYARGAEGGAAVEKRRRAA